MKYCLLIMILSLSISGIVKSASTDSLKYVDAKELQLIGKGFTDGQFSYSRLPAGLESKTRPPVWSLSKNCAGLAIRFHSDSPVIGSKWEVTDDAVMNHFAPSGIKGLDLYCLVKGKWEFVNSARPTGKASKTIIIDHMAKGDKEYMLYLPLYDGLANLEIGVEQSAHIGFPTINSPKKEKPVVFYGTSITQGGCASRTGMSYPSILSRMLDRQTINLGFSGNGQLDLEIAEVIADIDASCIVMDCLPNVSAEQMNEKYVPFLNIIRKKQPTVPILMVENIAYPFMNFDKTVYSSIHEKNALLKKIYAAIKKEDHNVYYLKADKLIGNDLEATVDGIHLTDLGFLRFSQGMYPAVKKLIK